MVRVPELLGYVMIYVLAGIALRLGVPSGNSRQTYSNRGVLREVDLSGATSATLTFDYRGGRSRGKQTVVLSISETMAEVTGMTLQTLRHQREVIRRQEQHLLIFQHTPLVIRKYAF